jgi:hypothetical protein
MLLTIFTLSLHYVTFVSFARIHTYGVPPLVLKKWTFDASAVLGRRLALYGYFAVQLVYVALRSWGEGAFKTPFNVIKG